MGDGRFESKISPHYEAKIAILASQCGKACDWLISSLVERWYCCMIYITYKTAMTYMIHDVIDAYDANDAHDLYINLLL